MTPFRKCWDDISEGIQEGFDKIDDFLYDLLEAIWNCLKMWLMPVACLAGIVVGIILFFTEIGKLTC
jgi:ABC-type methionine transport system permease subunit